MVRGFDHCLQFLARVERDNPTRSDRDLFAGLRIASGALRFLPQLEIAKTGQLDAVAGLQRDSDLLEKALDHVLGLPLIEAELFEEQVGEFGFGQRHWSPYWRNVALNRFSSSRSKPAAVASISASVKVRAVSCISTRIARLFFPGPTPGPR